MAVIWPYKIAKTKGGQHGRRQFSDADEREVGTLPASAAEGIAARADRTERHSDRRAHLGAGRGERLVPPALPRGLARLLDEPAACPQIRRAVPPSPSDAGPRLCDQGRVALS